MNIYERKGIDFEKLLKIGEEGEKVVLDFFNLSRSWCAKKVDHSKGYDIAAYHFQTKEIKKIEVKSHAGINMRTLVPYTTFFAEVHQNVDKLNSTPEYLNENNIDIVVHRNVYENTLYFFDGNKYKNAVIETLKNNKHLIHEAKYATSSGFTVKWNDESFGFMFKVAL